MQASQSSWSVPFRGSPLRIGSVAAAGGAVLMAFVRLLLWVGAVFMMVQAALVQAASPRLDSIRVQTGIDSAGEAMTQLILHIAGGGAARVDVFTLAAADGKPPRVVIDLPRLGLLRDQRLSEPGLISAIRFGHFRETTSRIVVETVAQARVMGHGWIAPDQYAVQLKALNAWATVVARAPMQPAAAQAGPQRPLFTPAPETPQATPPRNNRATLARSPAPIARPDRAGDSASADHRKLSDPRPLIVIDPGHGGNDPGALAGGIQEKDLTLQFSRRLARALIDSKRYRVLLTRDDDRFLKLRERVAIARKANADLLISIHADSTEDGIASGTSIYTRALEATDKEAAELARGENAVDSLGGLDMTDADADVRLILIDFIQSKTESESRRFAETLVAQLGGTVPALSRTRREAPFAVLGAPDVPSILLEMGYLSHDEDRKRLIDPHWQADLVRRMVTAIEQWAAKRPHMAVGN